MNRICLFVCGAAWLALCGCTMLKPQPAGDVFERVEPDALCIQESRVLPEELDDAIREPKGYTSIWHPAEKKGYSGVATFTKTEPILLRRAQAVFFRPNERGPRSWPKGFRSLL